jgi:hypothetical protein
MFRRVQARSVVVDEDDILYVDLGEARGRVRVVGIATTVGSILWLLGGATAAGEERVEDGSLGGLSWGPASKAVEVLEVFAVGDFEDDVGCVFQVGKVAVELGEDFVFKAGGADLVEVFEGGAKGGDVHESVFAVAAVEGHFHVDLSLDATEREAGDVVGFGVFAEFEKALERAEGGGEEGERADGELEDEHGEGGDGDALVVGGGRQKIFGSVGVLQERVHVEVCGVLQDLFVFRARLDVVLVSKGGDASSERGDHADDDGGVAEKVVASIKEFVGFHVEERAARRLVGFLEEEVFELVVPSIVVRVGVDGTVGWHAEWLVLEQGCLSRDKIAGK